MKRGFDIVASAIGLLALSPVLLLVAASIRLVDGSPILFRQTRVGREGKPFRIVKFRTMTRDERPSGPTLTVGDDVRITRTGRWLRKLKLDELPQLWNVLRGDMRLVGPRPEVPKYAAHYPDELRRVLRLTPGITDPASLRFRNESDLLASVQDAESYYIRVLLPEKIRTSLAYAERSTLWTDLGILARTAACALPSRRPAAPDDLEGDAPRESAA